MIIIFFSFSRQLNFTFAISIFISVFLFIFFCLPLCLLLIWFQNRIKMPNWEKCVLCNSFRCKINSISTTIEMTMSSPMREPTLVCRFFSVIDEEREKILILEWSARSHNEIYCHLVAKYKKHWHTMKSSLNRSSHALGVRCDSLDLYIYTNDICLFAQHYQSKNQ